MKIIFFKFVFLFPLFLSCTPQSQKPPHLLSPLASPVEWKQLEKFSQTLTLQDFKELLENNYLLDTSQSAELLQQLLKLPNFSFASKIEEQKASPRYWHLSQEISLDAQLPLKGLKIALDPGHIGGDYALMEERYFKQGRSLPVIEGDMNLLVAQKIEQKLTKLGAEVFLLRNQAQPITSSQPKDFIEVAKQHLIQKNEIPADPKKWKEKEEKQIQKESEKLFYRVSDIRARAQKVNEEIKPDLVLCIHFNATDWGDPLYPQMSDQNHLHLLVNGAYSNEELAYEDIRFEMLLKLLNGSHEPEMQLSQFVADALAKESGLPPPFLSPKMQVKKVGLHPYIWARNLLANRLYQCPVVYLEPYVMNNPQVFGRVQIGDYPGLRRIEGKERKSIYEEYADGVVEGVVRWRRK